MEFYIIQRIKNPFNRLVYISMSIFIFSVMLDIIFSDLYGDYRVIILAIFIGQFFIISFSNLFRSFVAEDFKKIGLLKFFKDGLSIDLDTEDSKFFELDKISALRIDYNGFKGQGGSYYKSLASSDGAYNLISFKHNITDYEFLFLLENKFQANRLRSYIDYLVQHDKYLIFNDAYSVSNYFGFGLFTKTYAGLKTRRRNKK